MTPDRARAVLARVLHRIAPELDLATCDDDALLQDELALDSMDFLHLVEALRADEGIDVPEHDFPELATVGGFVRYLTTRGR